MAQEMLALPEPPAALGRFLAERSAGNPLFVAEYLKLAVTEGLLARDDEGRWQVGNAPEMVPATLPVPVTVREVVQRRIAALGADARHVAECAALCDREIEPAVAGAMAALPYERWQDAVAELVRSHVLEDAAAGALRFAHDALREAAQDGIEEHRHRELHRAAARAIESLHAGQGAWMGALGRHHELSGEEERARRCYLEGARYAIDQYAYVEAERLTRSFLALTKAPDPESVQARIALGKTALSRRGVMDAAREELETAVKEARALGEPRLHAAALYALAVVTRDGSAAAARDLFAASLDVARGHGHREEEIEALTALGTLSSEQGRFDDALAFLEEAVVIARAAGLGRAEGVALANRANTLVSLRRDADAEETFDRAIARFGETGDVRARAVLLGNLANLRRLQGRATQARALTEQALALGREIGDRRFEGSMLAFLAYQQSETDVEGALGAYRDAVAISRDVGDRRMEAMEIGNMAGLLSQSGRVDEARDFFARAVALHVGLGSRHHAAGFYADWAAMELLSREDQSIAEGLLEKAEALARELGDALEICKASCVRGHLALACGLDASGDLAASREIAHRIGADVELARRIEVLARTQAAFEAGESLWRGYREEDLTEAQRRWRRDTGNLSTGSSSASQK
ncbi:MAG: tetratricopeptide repeat protein [Acidobacteriota bacterium]